MNYFTGINKETMSQQNCQAGDTSGFPVRLAQSLYTEWPATDRAQAKLQKIIAPTDFTVQWGPPAQSARISVTYDQTHFQIRGIQTVANATTLTLGAATYSCSEVLSVTQSQHRTFSQDPNAIYEVILAFQIRNKSLNPSAPDIILMCRPIVFSEVNSSPFWVAVNTSVKRREPQTTSLDMSTLYGYDQSTLMPMITYRTCLPVKLHNYKGATPFKGSISVRVHVVPQPIYMIADEDMKSQCSLVSKYILVTEPRRPVDMFDGASANTRFQFKDGLGSDEGFPSNTNDQFVPQTTPTPISAFADVIQKFQILVPEAFLGKSLAEISATGTPAPPPKRKKAYKCYRINPEKDIKNGQILVDPETGQSLSKTLEQKELEDAGGDPSLVDDVDTSSGLMPGDIQQILFIVLTVLGTITLLAYFMFVVHTVMFRKDFHNGIIHFVIFIVLLFGLVVFGILFGKNDGDTGKLSKDLNPNTNGTTGALDPNANGTSGFFNKGAGDFKSFVSQ